VGQPRAGKATTKRTAAATSAVVSTRAAGHIAVACSRPVVSVISTVSTKHGRGAQAAAVARSRLSGEQANCRYRLIAAPGFVDVRD
jgi:hypothetical protein